MLLNLAGLDDSAVQHQTSRQQNSKISKWSRRNQKKSAVQVTPRLEPLVVSQSVSHIPTFILCVCRDQIITNERGKRPSLRSPPNLL